STQSINLAGIGTTFDCTSNFRIEDRMHHRVDADLPLSNGLITWVAGNLYVTQPGTQSSGTSDTDSNIQRGIDAAPGGTTVNVEKGTYAENVSITKALTLNGAGSSGLNATTILPAGGTGITVATTGADVAGIQNLA